MQRIERELPRPEPISAPALRWPFWWLALFTLLPHFLGSLVNISYNHMQIVSHWNPEQQARFARLVMCYNAVIYPACIILAIWVVRPPFRMLVPI